MKYIKLETLKRCIDRISVYNYAKKQREVHVNGLLYNLAIQSEELIRLDENFIDVDSLIKIINENCYYEYKFDGRHKIINGNKLFAEVNEKAQNLNT